MSVLVTGGAGYIGGQTLLALLDRNEQVVVLDDLSTRTRSAVPAAVPLVLGDVGDIELVTNVIHEHRVEAIMHFAAKIIVPESVADPLAYYDANTVKSRNLMEAAVRAKVGCLVFSSTAAVYGNAEQDPVSEEAVPGPLSPYGKSKLMSEEMLRDVTDAYGITHGILRYFNVAGADPTGRHGQSTRNATHLMKVAIEAALGTRHGMKIFGSDYPTRDGTCVRDFVHVSDLAHAHLAVLDHLRRGGASCTVNCGYGSGYSVREVVDAVQKVLGSFSVELAPRRKGDPISVVADNRRLLKLGWQPQFNDLDTIVRHAVIWEKGRLAVSSEVGRSHDL